jgi:hypothetical protein
MLASAQPVLVVTESKKSFGTVTQGDQVKLEYEVNNTGTQPLIFDRYEVTCSCTSAQLPTAPLAPGATTVITVEFKTAAAIGLQDRTVKVYYSSSKKSVKLRFRGTVTETGSH